MKDKLSYLSKYGDIGNTIQSTKGKPKKKSKKKSKKKVQNETLLRDLDEDDFQQQQQQQNQHQHQYGDGSDEDGPVICLPDGSFSSSRSKALEQLDEKTKESSKISTFVPVIAERRTRFDSKESSSINHSEENAKTSSRKERKEQHLEDSQTKSKIKEEQPSSTELRSNHRHDSDSSSSISRHASDRRRRRRRKRYDSDDESKNGDVPSSPSVYSSPSPPRRRRRHDSDDDDSSYLQQNSGNKRQRFKNNTHSRSKSDSPDIHKNNQHKRKRQRHDSSSSENEDTYTRKKHESNISSKTTMETTYRDSKTGLKVDMNNRYKNVLSNHRKEQLKSIELNKGKAQKEREEQMKQTNEFVKSQPFARTDREIDMETGRIDEIRAGDPMAMLALKKDDSTVKPIYKGPPPKPNRFNIKPGYRWDGINRGNGFEDRVLALTYSQAQRKEDAYKWSTADM